jgi:hypothetical protein
MTAKQTFVHYGESPVIRFGVHEPAPVPAPAKRQRTPKDPLAVAAAIIAGEDPGGYTRAQLLILSDIARSLRKLTNART